MIDKIMKQNKPMTAIPLLALCIGFFMVIMDVTIVNVALPNIALHLHGEMTGLQWVVDGYTLTFACLLLTAGKVSDKIGPKITYLWGLALFVITSLVCGLANSLVMLVFFRLLQGIAAALVVPASLALLNASYHCKQQRARAIGIWGGVSGIAAALGPVLGALLTVKWGWRAVFFVNIPIGIVGFILAYQLLRNPISNRKVGLDLMGQVSAMISIALLAISLIEAGRLGWSSTLVIGAFIASLASFLVFLQIEHCSAAPMLPLLLFRNRNFSLALSLGMLISLGFYGVLFMLPLYFQQIKHYSVIQVGLAIVPLSGLAAMASYLGGKLASVKGMKQPIVIGLIISSIGFWSLSVMGPTVSYYQLILPIAALGFGTAFTMPVITIAAMQAVCPHQAGLASGALLTSRQIGSLMGVAIFGTLISSAATFHAGMQLAMTLGGCLFSVGIVLVGMTIDRSKKRN